MPDIRTKIELWFESFGHLIYRHRWIALITITLLTGCLASQLHKITINTSTESFLHKDDPTILAYNDFRRQFGSDEFISIAIPSADIFSLDFLKKLKVLHEDLENQVPHIEEVISLINARNTRGDKDRLIVEELLENWPKSDVDLETLHKRVLSNKLYLNRVISSDGRFTAVVIRTDTYSSLGSDMDILKAFDEERKDADESAFLTDTENHETIIAVQEVLARHKSANFKPYLAGSPVFTDVLKRHMLKDMLTFMRLVLLTIGLCLYIMFRRLTGVLLPFLIVASALLSTMGLMAIWGVSMTLPTNILPSFLLAVGVGAAVHVLSIFYQNFQKTGAREESICKALGHSGLAIVMTSLTTAAGLASFSSAELAPIAQLGLFAGIGVLIALINTIVLLPSLLAIIPIQYKGIHQKRDRITHMDRLLDSVADFSTDNAKMITIVSIVLIILSVIGVSRISFSHNPMVWLSEKLPIRLATEKIDRRVKRHSCFRSHCGYWPGKRSI